MQYCCDCGQKVELKIPAGDNRERHVCVSCEKIHYSNPRIIAGTLPLHEGKILLCRRAIEPRFGLWTLPAGFMENGETTEEGALRETLEEGGARLVNESLYCVYSIPHISQVYMIYRGQLADLDFAPGEESLEVDLFDMADIPWQELAFPVMTKVLEHYCEDQGRAHFPLHTGVILSSPRS